MENLNYADIVSSLALLTALVALLWNIVRDLVTDRVNLDIQIAFGEIGNIKGTTTTLFLDAGSLTPNHYFDNPGTFVHIVNTGRKAVCVSAVGGKYKDSGELSMAVHGLPKMLEPYESFSTTMQLKQDFFNQVKNDEIESLWALDTKNKKWKMSKRGWERLRKTAEYISEGKHINK